MKKLFTLSLFSILFLLPTFSQTSDLMEAFSKAISSGTVNFSDSVRDVDIVKGESGSFLVFYLKDEGKSIISLQGINFSIVPYAVKESNSYFILFFTGENNQYYGSYGKTFLTPASANYSIKFGSESEMNTKYNALLKKLGIKP